MVLSQDVTSIKNSTQAWDDQMLDSTWNTLLNDQLKCANSTAKVAWFSIGHSHHTADSSKAKKMLRITVHM